MKLPKYKFYIGTQDTNLVLRNTSIKDNGEYEYGISNIDSYDMNTVKDGYMIVYLQKYIYQEEKFYRDVFSTVYFYDKDSNFIESFVVSNNRIIIPPANAYFYSLRYAYNIYGDRSYRSPLIGNEVYFVNRVRINYKELSKKYTKESGQEFFRASLDGKITLFNEAYNIVNDSNIESQLIFIIDKYNTVDKEWQEYYRGEFNKTDCKFDYGLKKCELKVTTNDGYNQLLDKYENNYNIIKLLPNITRVYATSRPVIQIYVRGSNTITNFFSGTYSEKDVSEPIDDHNSLLVNYYFTYTGAANEFYIKDSKYGKINGVYAGTNGYWKHWNNYLDWPNYVCKMEQVSEGSDKYCIRLYEESNNTPLYQSLQLWEISSTSKPTLPVINLENIFIEGENIVLANVNDSADTITISTIFAYHLYKRILCNTARFVYNNKIIKTNDLPLNDFATSNRNYKKCIGQEGGLIFCTSRTVKEATKYGINDYNEYFTDKFLPSTSGLGRALPICRSTWANASLWYVYDADFEILEKRLRSKYALRDNYSIGEVIKALLKEISPTIIHDAAPEFSTFLYDTNPIMTNKFYVYLTQKSNVLKGNYDSAAQKAEVSLKSIMDMLRDCFRCYWYIDDNKLKIEHISFFINGGSYSPNSEIQLDFTSLKDQFNKKLSSYFQSEIEYDKSDLNARYEFNFMDDATEYFSGVYIDINSNYVQKGKKEEITVSEFSSDIDLMLIEPDNFSDDGFTLLCPIKNSDNELQLPISSIQLTDENGNYYNATIQNIYASWAYLINLYLRDMPAPRMKCNILGEITAHSIKNSVTHNIEIPTEEDLDTLKLIKTQLGNGVISEISTNIDTRHTKIKLRYKPE